MSRNMLNANDRSALLDQLRTRNLNETERFLKLIKSQNKLFDLANVFKNELTEFKIANQKLLQENSELIKSSGTSGASSSMATTSYSIDKMRNMDEQLLKAKDEVIDLQKKLVAQAQQVIDLNKQLKDKNDELSLKEVKIVDLENRMEILKNTNRDLENKMLSYDEMIKLWKDEKVEGEVQYNCLLQKYEKLKDDYQQLLASYLRFKEEQIEKVNKLNDYENERLQMKLKEDLEKASQPVLDFVNITNPNTSNNNRGQVFSIPLVNRAITKFDCHEGEVNAVKFHKTGKYFATGGGDRKIKLWEIKDSKCELMTSLIGSNASIASIDIDSENNLIAGTSFDFACRLWSLNEQRLRMSSGDLQPTHTLTGHTNKVHTGKFLGIMKVVTGSYDRTLKVWDLIQKACIKTLFAGSSCNDLVTLDSQSIISGHLDKKIRFWDVRSDPPQSEICLQDRNYLLASVRDVNALKMIDIRMNQVMETYCCEEFKTSCDWARAIFSPDIDHQFVASGSADGSLIIWNSSTAKVEKVLKEHNAPVLSLSWHPTGNYLVSCDSKKKAVVWGCT